MFLIDLAENVIGKRKNHGLSSLIFWVIYGHSIRSGFPCSFKFWFEFNVELIIVKILDASGVWFHFIFIMFIFQPIMIIGIFTSQELNG